MDYKKHFNDTMHFISNATEDNSLISEKERELIDMLLECLSFSEDSDVHGSANDLKNALQFYLAAKRKMSGSDWIVRGFDQLDGAPFLCERSRRMYEFSLVSMKNMTSNGKDMIPWPLDEEMLNSCQGTSIYFEQLKNIVDTKKDYLLFYLFYGAFFSKAGITFSYVQDEDGIKQRPFFVVDMIKPVKPLKRAVSIDPNPLENIEYKVKTDGRIIDVSFDKRDEKLYSICAYKFFLSKVIGKDVYYVDEYHIKYFIENEACAWISEKCGYSKKNIDKEFIKLKEYLVYWFPFLDEADIFDIRRFVEEKFYTSRPQNDYLQRKRDFLIAKWEDKGVNYMNFNSATQEDIKAYINGNYLESKNVPHKKICQECNFNSVCMKYYYDKVTD